MTRRLLAWADRWQAMPTDDKIRTHGLVLCLGVFLVHYALYSHWYIEDAAITFSFARNAASGEGFVAWAGGERVEGFSNPTWTLLLTALYPVGIDPWTAAKFLGVLCGAASLPLALAWAREIIGPEARYTPLLAPLFLALSPQFVLWCSSGLENSLFDVLLAAGAVLLLREVREGGRPWSALAWSLLAITRPEGPLYAAVAGLTGFLWMTRRRGWRESLRWAVLWNVLFLVPFGLWHAWRYWYFAWPFPNTYYAKLGRPKFFPWDWHKKHYGWWYLRDYALWSGQALVLPAYLIGQTGLKGRRGLVGAAIAIGTVLLVLPGLTWPIEVVELVSGAKIPWTEPDPVAWVRIAWLAGLAVAVPWIGWGRPGVEGRTLAWWLTCITVFFAVYSGGDWMGSWRWLSLCAVGLAVLLADAIDAVVSEIPEHGDRWVPSRRTAATILATPVLLGSMVGIGLANTDPDVSPFTVRRRVVANHDIQKRLHLDHAVNLEVDFGAQMWWTGHELIDLAGLTDVPLGQHNWEPPFIREYLYAQRRPTFAHVHDSWAKRTGVTRHHGWKQYVALPGVPVSPWRDHVGTFLHKSTFTARTWRGAPHRNTAFGDRAVLEGWEAPIGMAAPGFGLYLEVGWSAGPTPGPFRALVFLKHEQDDAIVVHELPPGYDWLPVTRWKEDVILGRHTIPLPEDLPTGRYDLGFVLLTEEGVLPVSTPPRDARAQTEAPFRMAEGEVRWQGVIQIRPVDALLEEGQRLLALAHANAAEDRCVEAEVAWHQAREALPDHDWYGPSEAGMQTALARCFAGRAAKRKQVQPIRNARRWNHRDPEVIAVGKNLADRWEADGNAAVKAGNLDMAFRSWNNALYADPTRAWLRKKAEAVRDQRLGIEGSR